MRISPRSLQMGIDVRLVLHQVLIPLHYFGLWERENERERERKGKRERGRERQREGGIEREDYKKINAPSFLLATSRIFVFLWKLLQNPIIQLSKTNNSRQKEGVTIWQVCCNWELELFKIVLHRDKLWIHLITITMATQTFVKSLNFKNICWNNLNNFV